MVMILIKPKPFPTLGREFFALSPEDISIDKDFRRLSKLLGDNELDHEIPLGGFMDRSGYCFGIIISVVRKVLDSFSLSLGGGNSISCTGRGFGYRKDYTLCTEEGIAKVFQSVKSVFP